MSELFAVVSQGSCVEHLSCGTNAITHKGHSRGFATTDGKGVRVRTHSGLNGLKKNGLVGEQEFAGIGVASKRRLPVRLALELETSAIGVDGKMTNRDELIREWRFRGHKFSSRNDDGELIATLISSQGDLEAGIRYAFDRVAGHCNFLLLVPGGVYAASGLHGVRLFSIGEKDGVRAISTDPSTLRNGSGFKITGEVEPGRVVFLGSDGFKTVSEAVAAHRLMRCWYECMSLASPASMIDGIPVAAARNRLGARLAEADIEEGIVFLSSDTVVGSAPYFGQDHSLGYAMRLGLPHLELFDSPAGRGKGTKTKPIQECVWNKRVVLLDVSISSDIVEIVSALRLAGAVEVHLRIITPNLTRSCKLNSPGETDFTVPSLSNSEVERLIEATSVRFMTPASVMESIGLPLEKLCLGCFLSSQG